MQVWWMFMALVVCFGSAGSLMVCGYTQVGAGVLLGFSATLLSYALGH